MRARACVLARAGRRMCMWVGNIHGACASVCVRVCLRVRVLARVRACVRAYVNLVGLTAEVRETEGAVRVRGADGSVVEGRRAVVATGGCFIDAALAGILRPCFR